MKKHTLLFVTICLLVFMSACSDKEADKAIDKAEADVTEEKKDGNDGKDEKEETEEVVEEIEEEEEEEEEDGIPKEYEELMDLYETAISEEWEEAKLIEYGFGYGMENPGSLPKDYGYYFTDINGNGKKEMILGYELELEDGKIHKENAEIYTIVDGQAFKVFTGALRHGADIFADGTVHEYSANPGTGEQFAEYYQIKYDGTKDIEEEYMYDAATDTYFTSFDSDEQISETEVEKIKKEYGEAEEITFTPFLEVETSEGEVSDEQAAEIKQEVYDQVRDFLIEGSLDESLEEYLADGQVESLWKNGVDRESDFYQAAYDLHYDEVKHVVTESGMKSYIEYKIHYDYYGTSPSSFIPKDKHIEILDQADDKLKVEQTIEIGPQDAGGDSYDIVYQITFAKEDDVWKLDDIKEIDNPGKV